ncbi:MAG TPA: hopanoid biosynthesis-associated protein HpnK [Burkholderiales bacterium]|nr:hopanoid biosynthesis-associated protein HpnK [Burkholderiales bacterium]
MAPRQVIVTADDFGLSPAVNEAIERSHRDGVLRCASLMAGGVAMHDAVQRARRLPELRVGLHVVVVDGRPVLPATSVPDLVDRDGRFGTRLVRAGVRFFFVPRVRRQLEAEIRAQFEAFAATGLLLDHVNVHKHMHLHPTVLSLILKIGREFGVRAMRLPYEPVHALRALHAAQRIGPLLSAALLAPWNGLLRRRMRRAGIRFNQYVFGLSATGRMTEEIVLRILQRLPEGVSEIYFHPVTAFCADGACGAMFDWHEAELRALVSPRVRAALTASGIRMISFSELA